MKQMYANIYIIDLCAFVSLNACVKLLINCLHLTTSIYCLNLQIPGSNWQTYKYLAAKVARGNIGNTSALIVFDALVAFSLV